MAFLNTNGGHLVIGVDNDKKLIGIEIDQFPSTDEWQRYLVDKIKTKRYLNTQATDTLYRHPLFHFIQHKNVLTESW